MSTAWLKKVNGPVSVSPEALNVATELVGAPLASPSRRALAIALDGILIGMLSSINALWPIAGAVVIVGRLRSHDAPVSARNRKRLFIALGVLVLIAVAQLSNLNSERRPAKSSGIEFNIGDDDPGGSKVAGPIVQKTGSESAVEKQLTKQVAALEHDLKLARQSKARTWIDDVKAIVRSNGIDFGGAIAYFTLLPFWWKGQTVGKRVLGLRIVELTGKPLTLMHAFSRYGGYAAGMATGGFGFLQVFWDHNRQAIQDKIAHTVVIDLRSQAQQRSDTPPESEIAPIATADKPDPQP